MAHTEEQLDKNFIKRRLHSLLGLMIVLFLIEHLVTNSQAALLFGESGMGFVHAVNFIKGLPYLPVIEIALIGVPIVLHAYWGIKIALQGRPNSGTSDGSVPSLPEYGRNRSYTWQRITSWILLFGILAHVGYMRFYLYPASVNEGATSSYFVRLNVDPGLYTVASRLNVALYDQTQIESLKSQLEEQRDQIQSMENDPESTDNKILAEPPPSEFSEKEEARLNQLQLFKLREEWVAALTKRSITSHQVIAVTKEFGTALLLNVRNAFKSPFECVLYTIFVLSAVFHAFNGLWTFLITWGIVLKMRSQRQAVNVCLGLMFVMGFLGLISIWGTYWINLRQ